MKRVQTQQADIAGFVASIFQRTAINVPTHIA
jgi:3-dehydroquinate synthetase